MFSAGRRTVTDLGAVLVDRSYRGALGSSVVVPPGDHTVEFYYESSMAISSLVLRLTLRVGQGKIAVTSGVFDIEACAELENPAQAKQVADKWRAQLATGSNRDPIVLTLPDPPQYLLHDCRPGAIYIEYGRVKISSAPTGADVFVNGKFVGRTDATLRIQAGRPVHILIRKGGYKDLAQTMTFSTKGDAVVSATLAPK